jgi:Zn-dependent protease
MFLGAGWQKPFNFNTGRLRDKKKGLIAITLIGILSNLLLMAILIPIFVSTFNQNYYITKFLFIMILFNLAIVIVNLLPVPPLDMVKIIQALNPSGYFKFVQYEKVIQALFILFLASGFISNLVNIIINSIFSAMMITGL